MRVCALALKALISAKQNGMLFRQMSVKVKICGITNLADGLAAAEAGADALGFNFYEQSPRKVSLAEAAGIIRELPLFIIKVGVFVNPEEDQVFRAIAECGLNLLQFHGEETPEYCLRFGLMSMKAFRGRDAASLPVRCLGLSGRIGWGVDEGAGPDVEQRSPPPTGGGIGWGVDE